MRRRLSIVVSFLLPVSLTAQATARPEPIGAVMLQFQRFADIFGSRLVAAFDSIPANRYDYRPTPVQQSIGYIAQHLEDANYSLCSRFGVLTHQKTASDSVADTVKARWPKDTLIGRLRKSFDFCDTALGRVDRLESPALVANLLAFETDLAEHYSQLASYMRLLGMVPPSALPPIPRKSIDVPASSLAQFAGVYEVTPGVEFDVAVRDGALFVRPSRGGPPVRLWPEGPDAFFVKEADAQITFTRGANGGVTGLVLHQFGRARPAKRTK